METIYTPELDDLVELTEAPAAGESSPYVAREEQDR